MFLYVQCVNILRHFVIGTHDTVSADYRGIASFVIAPVNPLPRNEGAEPK